MACGGGGGARGCGCWADDRHAECGEDEAEACDGHDGDGVALELGFHDGAEGLCGDDLGDDDEEVEDAHEESHFFGWDVGGDDGVGDGEDACPGDADADHGDEELIFIGKIGDEGEADTTDG